MARHLAQHVDGVDVTLFEKEPHLAGHRHVMTLSLGGTLGSSFDSADWVATQWLPQMGLARLVDATRAGGITVEIHRDGYVWRQAYLRGVPEAPLERGDPTDRTGTAVTFWADEEVFDQEPIIEDDLGPTGWHLLVGKVGFVE